MPFDKAPLPGSTHKDTDVRSVVEEFGRLLEIFSAQLAESLHEADGECTAVGESFHEMAAAKARIEGIECQEPERSVLRTECTRIGRSLGTAVEALQYHDRLTQRIGHIRVGLNHLQELLRHKPDRSDDDWLALLQNVERSYHLEWHRLARAAGPGVGEAADADAAAADANGSSVELF
jgi:hypothetical protein